jgi:hypothetical protein
LRREREEGLPSSLPGGGHRWQQQPRPQRQSDGMTSSSPDVESAKKRKRRRKKMMAAMARRRLEDDLLSRQDQGREEQRDAGREPSFSSPPGNNIDDDVDDDDDDDEGRSSIAKANDPRSDGGEEDDGSGTIARTRGGDRGGRSPNQQRRRRRRRPLRRHGIGNVVDDGISASDAVARDSEIQRRTMEGTTRGRHHGRDDDDFAAEQEDDDDDDDDKEGGVSVEALKRKILGRSIPSMYDSRSDGDCAVDACASFEGGRASRPIMAEDDGSSSSAIARRLQHELSCPICHDRLYDPASLLCGHTFCYACLDWWLEGGRRTCPSCREPIPPPPNDDDGNNKPRIRINTVLKTVLDALYPTEMNLRRLAELRRQRRAISGEAGGSHSRGSGVEVEPLPEEGDELYFLRGEWATKDDGAFNRDRDEEHGWKALYSSRPGWSSSSSMRQQGGGGGGGGKGAYSHGSGVRAMIRRNIVLDDTDQRYQLSFGLTKCTYHPDRAKANSVVMTAPSAGVAVGTLDIELCLLAMEEDEVDDAGFPIVINEGDDNEALICAGRDNRWHTCIESSMRVVPHSWASLLSDEDKKEGSSVASGGPREGSSRLVVREIPLSRGMLGRDGTVRFRIDMKNALEGAIMTMMKDEQDDDDDDEEEEEEGSVEGSDGETNNNDVNNHCEIPSSGGGVRVQVVKLIFRHVDSGAVLELRLPSRNDIDGIIQECDEGLEFCVNKPGGDRAPKDKNGPSRYLLDDLEEEDEDDNDEPNQYEEDSFLVHGSQNSDDEEEFDSVGEQNDDFISDNDDENNDDECQICKNGGELIVCDGGDHPGGCGRSYHVHCIDRTMIPPGKRFFPCFYSSSNFL